MALRNKIDQFTYKFTLVLPAKLTQETRAIALEHNVSLSEHIRRAIGHYNKLFAQIQPKQPAQENSLDNLSDDEVKELALQNILNRNPNDDPSDLLG